MSENGCPGFSRSGQIVYGSTLVCRITRPILFPAAFADPVPIELLPRLHIPQLERVEKESMSTMLYRAILTGMLPRVIATISLASLIVLSLMLVFTSPADAGPFGLLLIFITAYLAFVGVISFFLFGMNRLLVMVASGMTVRKPLTPLPFKRAYYYSTVLAAAPVILIGFQSVQSIGFYEVALVIVFEVVACLYVSRRMK